MSEDLTEEIRTRFNRAKKLGRYSVAQCIELVAAGLGIDAEAVREVVAQA